jgi:hypothetical protein
MGQYRSLAVSTPRRAAASSALLVLSLAACLAVVAPVATAQTAEPGFLLVQSARNGSLVPVQGSDDELTLTLGGVGEWALWFTDRPNRTSGHLPHQAALDLLGFDDRKAPGPPNAVLSVPDGARNRNMVALTLRAPRYDSRAKTLRYRATRLPTVARTPLAS